MREEQEGSPCEWARAAAVSLCRQTLADSRLCNVSIGLSSMPSHCGACSTSSCSRRPFRILDGWGTTCGRTVEISLLSTADRQTAQLSRGPRDRERSFFLIKAQHGHHGARYLKLVKRYSLYDSRYRRRRVRLRYRFMQTNKYANETNLYISAYGTRDPRSDRGSRESRLSLINLDRETRATARPDRADARRLSHIVCTGQQLSTPR